MLSVIHGTALATLAPMLITFVMAASFVVMFFASMTAHVVIALVGACVFALSVVLFGVLIRTSAT